MFHANAAVLGYWDVLFKSPLLTDLSSVIPLNVGTAFGETFFVAPGMASERRAEILTGFFREKITFLGQVGRKKISKGN